MLYKLFAKDCKHLVYIFEHLGVVITSQCTRRGIKICLIVFIQVNPCTTTTLYKSSVCNLVSEIFLILCVSKFTTWNRYLVKYLFEHVYTLT